MTASSPSTHTGNGTNQRSRGLNAGVETMHRAQRKHPNDPHKQLAAFLAEFTIKSGTGRARPVSQRTNALYGENLQRMLSELREERAVVRNLSEIGKAHALRLIGRWIKEGQSSGTIQTKVSYLRRFLTFLGKHSIIPKAAGFNAWLVKNGVQPPTSRSIVARESKAWDENDVDVFAILEKVRLNCMTTSLQLELQAAFGLRVKESMMIMPRQSDHGTHISVDHGTKGGLPRTVRFDDDEQIALWQRDLLERCKVVADQHPKRVMALRGRTLAQAIRHFYYQMNKVGVNRATLGVTAHGLRHQFAARRYQQITGFAAPVSPNRPTVINAMVKEVDLQARRQVSVDMGHFRENITGAYIGTIPMAEREKTKILKVWWAMTEQNPHFLKAIRAASIARVWLGGKFAAGVPVGPTEKMRLFVSTSDLKPLDDNTLFLLKNELITVLNRGVDLTEHFRTTAPDDSDELELPGFPTTEGGNPASQTPQIQ
jgi:integrase